MSTTYESNKMDVFLALLRVSYFRNSSHLSLLSLGEMASNQIKQEPSNNVSSKRVNYNVPPGKDPLNVRILLDMGMRDGYSGDYLQIVKTFRDYRHVPIEFNGWRGFTVSSTEFVRALAIGCTGTVRRRMAGSQTEESFFETQWSGGNPVDRGSGARSPDLFSDDGLDFY